MKRNRLSSRKRISADAAELGRLATCLAESGGKLEDCFWNKRNFLLMHAMGANTGGQVGSVMAAAIMLAVLGGLGLLTP